MRRLSISSSLPSISRVISSSCENVCGPSRVCLFGVNGGAQSSRAEPYRRPRACSWDHCCTMQPARAVCPWARSPKNEYAMTSWARLIWLIWKRYPRLSRGRRAPHNPVSRPSFGRVPPGMRSINPHVVKTRAPAAAVFPGPATARWAGAVQVSDEIRMSMAS